MTAKYVHTNLIARDWKNLAGFYQNIFGCIPVPPQRHLSGDWLEQGSGVADAEIQGIHLRLPGYGNDGPTLEIFQYNRQLAKNNPAANRPGFGHICFAVPDVHEAKNIVLKAGGGAVGEVVSVEISPAGTVTWVYVTDPEGNIIELQKWIK
ncbi:MAG: VOC family protein [Calditrichaeota bacterium]|nr:MAG: VOC family protein [Calditrichota bacterium]